MTAYTATEAREWRRRALDAEAAIRSLVGMVGQLDHEADEFHPADYVATPTEQAAVRRAMRNSRRSRRRVVAR